jgi:hypothetical protein
MPVPLSSWTLEIRDIGNKILTKAQGGSSKHEVRIREVIQVGNEDEQDGHGQEDARERGIWTSIHSG